MNTNLYNFIHLFVSFLKQQMMHRSFTYQGRRFEVPHYWILSNRQVQLVTNQQQASRDGVCRQVKGGSHGNGDDAKADGEAREHPGAAFKHLRRSEVN